jgi:hypothetical protein
MTDRQTDRQRDRGFGKREKERERGKEGERTLKGSREDIGRKSENIKERCR